MIRALTVSGPSARGALLGVMLTAALPALCWAQAQEAPAAGPASVAPTAAPVAPSLPPGISESVAAVVNDEIVSTYDLAQRMRLLIATSGVQPTQQNLPQFQREALVGLVDERLQLHELKRVEKDQKISLIAAEEEIDEQIADMAKQNNASPQQFQNQLKAQGIGVETLRQQLRAQTSWQRWIRGRYGSRLRIGEDQIKAQQQMLAAAASKPQYSVSEVFLDAARVGGMETAVQGATQLVSQLQQGAPFQAVARQFSASATAASGGRWAGFRRAKWRRKWMQPWNRCAPDSSPNPFPFGTVSISSSSGTSAPEPAPWWST